MRLLEKTDDFLIDELFQKITNWSQRSNFLLARMFAWLALLSQGAYQIGTWWGYMPFSMLNFAVYITMIFSIYRPGIRILEQQERRGLPLGTKNPWRMIPAFYLLRLAVIVLVIITLPKSIRFLIDPSGWAALMFLIFGLAWIPTLYFACCTPPPYRPKRARVLQKEYVEG